MNVYEVSVEPVNLPEVSFSLVVRQVGTAVIVSIEIELCLFCHAIRVC